MVLVAIPVVTRDSMERDNLVVAIVLDGEVAIDIRMSVASAVGKDSLFVGALVPSSRSPR
jgi:hypothetical protein